jgi:hypothetical protein
MPGDLVDDLPLLARLAGRRHDWLGVLDERRRVEAEEGERHVVALVEGRARQDVVGVAVRLVDVEVERDAQLEVVERLLERVPVRHRQHRIPRRHEERADLELAGRRDLARQERRGQVSDHVRKTAEARAHLAVAREPGLLPHVVERDRRAPEHRAARTVEVPRRRVERVDQERDQGPESPKAGARAPVRGRSRRGHRACQVPDRLGGHPRAVGAVLRRELARHLGESVRALRVLREEVAVGETLGEDHVQHREQKPRVGVRRDRDVLELARGLGPARVHDDDAPAAVHDLVQLLADPRRGQNRSVGHHRVRSDHEQESRAVEVRDRDEQRGAVQKRTRREAVVHVL